MLSRPFSQSQEAAVAGRSLRLVEGEDLISLYQQEQAWGLLTSLDLYDCDAEVIRDGGAIARYAQNLCQLLQVTAYGEPQVVHFGRGEVAGYSLVQLIETSLISGHFANDSNRAFIDIFSCAFYDPHRAARFTQEFFKAGGYTIHCILRK